MKSDLFSQEECQKITILMGEDRTRDEAITLLIEHAWDLNEALDSQMHECPICLRQVPRLETFPCNHGVCTICSQDMRSEGHHQCPLCRRDIPPPPAATPPQETNSTRQHVRWDGYVVTDAPGGKEHLIGFHRVTWAVLRSRLPLPATGLGGTGFMARYCKTKTFAVKIWTDAGREGTPPRVCVDHITPTTGT